MRALRLTLVMVSAFLLGAHFFRSGQLVLVAISLAGPLLLLHRRPWTAVAVQAGLFLGALEWLRTLVLLKETRQAAGEPYLRLVLILGAVTIFTAVSSLLMGSAYRRRPVGMIGLRP